MNLPEARHDALFAYARILNPRLPIYHAYLPPERRFATHLPAYCRYHPRLPAAFRGASAARPLFRLVNLLATFFSIYSWSYSLLGLLVLDAIPLRRNIRTLGVHVHGRVTERVVMFCRTCCSPVLR